MTFSVESLESLKTEIEAIANTYPEEYTEFQSIIEQLEGMISVNAITSQEIESIINTLLHTLNHINTYNTIVSKLSAAKVRANSLTEETCYLSISPNTNPPWGKPTISDPQVPVTHITAVIVDQPHTMLDKNHPYTRYRMVFKSELPNNSRYYMVYRRFNDVKRLNAGLIELKVGPIPPLPPQRAIFQSLYDPIFIEDRRQRLAEYLQTISCMLSVVKTLIFQKFITEDGQYRMVEEGYT